MIAASTPADLLQQLQELKAKMRFESRVLQRRSMPVTQSSIESNVPDCSLN